MASGFFGGEQLAEALAPLGERLADPGVLQLIGTLGARACRRNIDRQASPEGEAYAPTERGGTILRDTGILYNGITFEVETGRSVLVGAGAASSAYNAYQHFGSELWNSGAMWLDGKKAGRRKGNPPRPFIGISPDDVDEIAEEVADFLVGEP
jgi:phage gpG-like protein